MADKYLGIYRSETRRVDWHKYNGGEYFVTICTKDRVHYFGEIANGEMQLSAIGQYTHEQFMNVATHYPYAQIPLWIVMPDHIHAIVIIDGNAVVADCNDAINRIATTGTATAGGITGIHNPMISKCLGTIIRGTKARISHWAHQNNLSFGWQSNYHEHIIRDQNEMNRIADYIYENPQKWIDKSLNNKTTQP
ncbi:MAG: hypothetical protein II575_04060 [Bacteroidales bacterium]|nr:hypothetical protein [Bacteroidales bacterium]MBQ2573373.1 hypothetical protein [Bacteroidales bacterium]MBQ5423773.1 hypothetical protein [Bacteroidales bacterium]